MFATCFEKIYFGNDGDAKHFSFYFVLVAPTALRVERQKLMVNSPLEMSVRVPKGGVVDNLLLR